MQSSPQQHEHVHPEVVYLEDLRLCEEEDKDADELGEGDATDHRGPHVGQGRVSTLNPRGQVARAEPAHNVRAELYGDPDSLQGERERESLNQATLRTSQPHPSQFPEI